MAVYDEGFTPHKGDLRAGSIVNYAGAALSLALIAGVGFWGYNLIMRDVSGIPVVRAMEGEMRVLPDNPGGAVALHAGLAVNEVAAVGEAGGPGDVLVLAPATSGLAREDLDVQPAAEAEEHIAAPIQPAAESEQVAAQTQATSNVDDILALADQIAAGVPAFETPGNPDIIPETVPGIALSPRPVIRPASLQAVSATADDIAAAVATAATASPANEVAVTTAEFPAGTNLVQLGAFPTPALAAEEWARLQGRFGQLMTDKGRVIQISNQSSGTWYRLRASGFTDRAEARRFCTALEAEGANCIAVLVN